MTLPFDKSDWKMLIVQLLNFDLVIVNFDRYTSFSISHYIEIVIPLAVLPLFLPFGLAGVPLQYHLLLPALFHQNRRVEYD